MEYNKMEDKLAFKLAYSAVFLTADIGNGSSSDVSYEERDAIVSGILDLLEMMEEDIDGDGVVDRNDAEEVLQAALDAYDLTPEDGRGEKVAIYNHGFRGAADTVKEWIMNFYQKASDSEDSGAAFEEIEKKVLDIIRDAMYGE